MRDANTNEKNKQFLYRKLGLESAYLVKNTGGFTPYLLLFRD